MDYKKISSVSSYGKVAFFEVTSKKVLQKRQRPATPFEPTCEHFFALFLHHHRQERMPQASSVRLINDADWCVNQAPMAVRCRAAFWLRWWPTGERAGAPVVAREENRRPLRAACVVVAVGDIGARWRRACSARLLGAVLVRWRGRAGERGRRPAGRRRRRRPSLHPVEPTDGRAASAADAGWRALASDVLGWRVARRHTGAFDWRVGERRAGRQAPWRRALFASVDRRATGARARRRRRRQRRPARVGERRACSARCSSNALAHLRWRVGGRDAAGWSETLHLDRPAVVLTRTPSSTRRQNNVYGRA